MSGSEGPAAEVTIDRAVADVQQRGANPHVLEGAELTAKRTLLDGVAAALSFPEWAGRNLDALYDCLTDLSWLPEGEHVLVWSDSGALAETDPKAYRAILSVFDEARDNPACRRRFGYVLAKP